VFKFKKILNKEKEVVADLPKIVLKLMGQFEKFVEKEEEECWWLDFEKGQDLIAALECSTNLKEVVEGEDKLM